MSMLENFMARKKVADDALATTPGVFSAANVKKYLGICKYIYILQIAKFLTETAPESMNPKKIKDHLGLVMDFFEEFIPDEVGLIFTPEMTTVASVEEYKEKITKAILSALVIVNKKEGEF